MDLFFLGFDSSVVQHGSCCEQKRNKNYLHQMKSENDFRHRRARGLNTQPTDLLCARFEKKKRKKQRDRNQRDRQLHRSPREKAAGLVIGHTNLFLVDHGSAEECTYTSFPFVVILFIYHPSNASTHANVGCEIYCFLRLVEITQVPNGAFYPTSFTKLSGIFAS